MRRYLRERTRRWTNRAEDSYIILELNVWTWIKLHDDTTIVSSFGQPVSLTWRWPRGHAGSQYKDIPRFLYYSQTSRKRSYQSRHPIIVAVREGLGWGQQKARHRLGYQGQVGEYCRGKSKVFLPGRFSSFINSQLLNLNFIWEREYWFWSLQFR